MLRGGDSTEGDSAREAEDLAEWLRQERGLDALVDLVPRRVEPTYLGAVVEIVVAAMGSGGLAVPLLYKSIAT